MGTKRAGTRTDGGKADLLTEIAAGLRAARWDFEQHADHISLPSPPGEHEFPPRKEPYVTELRAAAPNVVVKATWRGKGTTERWVELAAFCAVVAPRLSKGELVVDTTAHEVSFVTRVRWKANGYDAFENAMCDAMSKLARLVDPMADVVRGQSARQALAALDQDEANRL